jgi:hypothetical protein
MNLFKTDDSTTVKTREEYNTHILETLSQYNQSVYNQDPNTEFRNNII